MAWVVSVVSVSWLHAGLCRSILVASSTGGKIATVRVVPFNGLGTVESSSTPVIWQFERWNCDCEQRSSAVNPAPARKRVSRGGSAI
jgi:hypothetical protein